MNRPTTVNIAALSTERICQALDRQGRDRLEQGLKDIGRVVQGRVLWNISSTARGGGVAEMLSSMLPYFRGAGIDSRWSVVEGSEKFFQITKRIHNFLHGNAGDGGWLGDKEKNLYRQELNRNYSYLRETIKSGDVVILHDPQVAGLAAPLQRLGATLIWRCHVGSDSDNQYTRAAWQFLLPELGPVDAFIFSRSSLVPQSLTDRHIHIIQPSLNPSSTKNLHIGLDQAHAILDKAGVAPSKNSPKRAEFTRLDGSPGRVEHGCEVLSSGPPPSLTNEPLIVQVSRWDRLKDHLGLMQAFADDVLPNLESNLILAGPSVHAVADDPEAAEVLDQIIASFWQLPQVARRHIQLVCLPMADIEENAAIVNALQTSASLVVQKSLAEGFGLTVAEAMWKRKLVLASAVGGIQDQIEDGVSGFLLQDAADLHQCAQQIVSLLNNPPMQVARAAEERVRRHFLHDRQISDQARLMSEISA